MLVSAPRCHALPGGPRPGHAPSSRRCTDVPLLSDSSCATLRRHVGLLVVQVVQARDLRKMDMLGKADPFVELYTQATSTVKTVRPGRAPHAMRFQQGLPHAADRAACRLGGTAHVLRSCEMPLWCVLVACSGRSWEGSLAGWLEIWNRIDGLLCGGACVQDVQKKTLTPTWNEDKWLLVQEPKTQIVRVQVFDHDAIKLKARLLRTHAHKKG